ncbi:MAG TPA: hypothetical protein VG101_11635 [Puia sp.]|jgi:hypothetical protein|nr:hypothetical protein [Puia sp.]
MDSNTIQQIVKEATNRLNILLEEAKQAEIAKEKRDTEIIKARAVLDLFANESNGSTSEHIPQVAAIQIPPPLPIYDLPTMNLRSFTYDPSNTWEDRVKGYFKFKNKVLTITQIVDEFKEYEPDYSYDKLKGAVTNIVAMMHKKGLLKVYDPGFKMRGFYYGNPLWFVGDELKEEHKPDLKEKLLW